MDANQFLHFENILKSQRARLSKLEKDLDEAEDLSVSKRLELLLLAGQIDGALTALMAVGPKQLVERYAPVKQSAYMLAEYALTSAMAGVEEMEDMMDEMGAEGPANGRDDMTVTDPFGRPVKPVLAGMRRRRRR